MRGDMSIRISVVSAIFIGLLLISIPALAQIRIERIRFDPRGDDDGSNDILNREVIRPTVFGTPKWHGCQGV
jgi:hypothetical protein